KKSLYGGFDLIFSIEAYKSLFNPQFLKVVINTSIISIISTTITVMLAIPTAYYIAKSKYKDMLLFLVIIPFLTNFLIRIFAWIAILGNNGILNNFMMNIGIIKNPAQFLYNQWAVIIVMVYTYLPFAILPLYSTIEKFDFSLLEAARDLGATKSQAFYKVLIPNIIPGITTAVLFTFIPIFGNFAVPDIVGGKDSVMVGNIINNQLKVAKNWPLSSSISVVLTIMTTIGVMIFMKLTKPKSEELRKIKEEV
ncbi:MAG TPA: ABC transporter permease, partial [Spirochaetota bacterium]|nr:ABC transporter permease [Spirochaetota bacterium]